MNLRQIRQFLAVAQTGSLRKAAEQLHMAQPPLTVSMRRLEDELGGRLFERCSQGMDLTPLGAAILEHARMIDFHAEQVTRTATNVQRGLAGLLKIAFVGSANYLLLPKMLPMFREQYPQVSLKLHEGTTHRILREVENGVLDLGIVRYPIFEPTTALVKLIEHDLLMAVLSKRHPLAKRKRLRLMDLADQAFIMYSSETGPSLHGRVMGIAQAAGFTPRIVQEARQVQTVVSLVESGVGIALVPSNSRRHAPDGVVFVPLSEPTIDLSVGLAVVSHPATESLVAARFRQMLEELA